MYADVELRQVVHSATLARGTVPRRVDVDRGEDTWPTSQTVINRFGDTWDDAVEAAGITTDPVSTVTYEGNDRLYLPLEIGEKYFPDCDSVTLSVETATDTLCIKPGKKEDGCTCPLYDQGTRRINPKYAESMDAVSLGTYRGLWTDSENALLVNLSRPVGEINFLQFVEDVGRVAADHDGSLSVVQFHRKLVHGGGTAIWAVFRTAKIASRFGQWYHEQKTGSAADWDEGGLLSPAILLSELRRYGRQHGHLPEIDTVSKSPHLPPLVDYTDVFGWYHTAIRLAREWEQSPRI